MTALPAEIARVLLDWYQHHQRRLPWRGDPDPYHVWLSEVMLQQTQVDTVKSYYRRWLERFPTIGHVARASQDEVLKAWEGLGYYRRARQFHAACHTIEQDHGGQFPTSPESFRQLPGVGPYTFAAVRSICFGDPLPAVDGNLRRVLARLLKAPQTGPALTRVAESSMAPLMHTRPGDINQAIMDLGATLCTPQKPHCLQCPLSRHCGAYLSNQVQRFPRREIRKPIPLVPVALGVVWRGDELLICRRPSDGLLGGLWEFPGGKLEPGETSAEAVRREIMEEVGLAVEVGPFIGTVRHTYTHFAITLDAYHCISRDGEARPLGCTQVRWIRLAELSRFAFPKANHKLFPLLKSPFALPEVAA
ncbi:MAG: A/G-specific adenine glycosylase [Candidatus Marinimicrobia bacterium]|nr:A/G-specific adenine glycosylase [Candidatus Neomarinimicrobiota bacterium]